MNASPKRARKYRLKGAPDYVLACYDNDGKTADRYTVLFGSPLWEPRMGRTVPYLAMSDNPSHPQGVSMWGEMLSADRRVNGRQVEWLELPENVRQHVIARAEN